MDTDSFAIVSNTNIVNKDSQNLIYFFDFGNVNKNHEIYCIKNKKVFGKFKIQTYKNVL